jgi:hypothetical protein
MDSHGHATRGSHGALDPRSLGMAETAKVQGDVRRVIPILSSFFFFWIGADAVHGNGSSGSVSRPSSSRMNSSERTTPESPPKSEA